MKRPPLIATILTLCAMAVLCGLGTWQIQRLEWKRALLAAIDAVDTAPASDIDAAHIRAAVATGQRFLRGTVRGNVPDMPGIRFGSALRDGVAGHHYITPLRLDDGSVLLVNHGWVPAGWDDAALRPGPVSLRGWLRVPDAPNRFTPAHDTASDHWYSLRDPALPARFGVTAIMPMVLYAEGGDAGPPWPVVGRPQLKNDHLSYALFWFAMAVALAVIFWLRFMRDKKG